MVNAFDAWHVVFLLLALMPAVVALVSILRNRPASSTETTLWIVVVLIAPLLGAVLWFAIGRRSARARRGGHAIPSR